jgi:hypothetical protein
MSSTALSLASAALRYHTLKNQIAEREAAVRQEIMATLSDTDETQPALSVIGGIVSGLYDLAERDYRTKVREIYGPRWRSFDVPADGHSGGT